MGFARAAVSRKVGELGAQYAVPLGSFNPKELACLESEFFDSMHPTQSCLNRTFEKRAN